MIKFKWLVIVALFLMAVPPSFADDRAKIVGTCWKLVSFEVERQETGELKPYLENSPNPRGYLILTPEGRMMTIITGEGRKLPQTVEDRSAAWLTMLAYSGMYRFEGDKFITKVDVAWNEGWIGTEQTRFFKLEGDRLKIISAWGLNKAIPYFGLGKTVRGILSWEPAK
jgi:hypothetical protein